jgi:hypothetical protein
MIIACRFNDRPFANRFPCVRFNWRGVNYKKVLQVPGYLKTIGYITFICSMAKVLFVADLLVTKFEVKQLVQISEIII